MATIWLRAFSKRVSFLKICILIHMCLKSAHLTISIGLDKDLMPNRRQVIICIWIGDDLPHWRIYALPGPSGLSLESLVLEWRSGVLHWPWQVTWFVSPARCIRHYGHINKWWEGSHVTPNLSREISCKNNKNILLLFNELISPLDKMAAISRTMFSDASSRMKMFVFWLKFHWGFFLRVQLTITQHWFR